MVLESFLNWESKPTQLPSREPNVIWQKLASVFSKRAAFVCVCKVALNKQQSCIGCMERARGGWRTWWRRSWDCNSSMPTPTYLRWRRRRRRRRCSMPTPTYVVRWKHQSVGNGKIMNPPPTRIALQGHKREQIFPGSGTSLQTVNCIKVSICLNLWIFHAWKIWTAFLF